MAGVIDPTSSTSCVSFHLLPVPSAHPSGPARVLPTPKAFVDAMVLRVRPPPIFYCLGARVAPKGGELHPAPCGLALLLSISSGCLVSRASGRDPFRAPGETREVSRLFLSPLAPPMHPAWRGDCGTRGPDPQQLQDAVGCGDPVAWRGAELTQRGRLCLVCLDGR